MLDCGMHMGYSDDRRFPDFSYVFVLIFIVYLYQKTQFLLYFKNIFSYISGGGPLNGFLDCVIISHFHLDHCGALPHMSEIVGYDGPIYMTYPTKAIVPVLLEDYRKVQTEFRGDTNFFTSQHIKQCMKKVACVQNCMQKFFKGYCGKFARNCSC